ncbi:DUF2388 domain-containing protein [Pseudomonas mangrovi]|uniref:ABC transporter ATP-binding protein n=1 Tax=Pseudomonas mangrovi TaxID=2161748 RepID=A0A2T5P609_9PSED|nr:DUF2388 domain-containing protein [Pseudomonas mangrovi]PTU73127.1 ABC transporter ATP-binding protein [Pseudomonas mangrovi]
MKPTRGLPLILGYLVSTLCGDALAGFQSPRFDEEPLVASTFYLAVSSILPTLTTQQPGEGSEVSDATSEDTSGSSARDDRRLREAREDAAHFVASGGAYRSVRLEAALRWLRGRPQSAGFDDLQLAAAILQR